MSYQETIEWLLKQKGLPKGSYIYEEYKKYFETGSESAEYTFSLMRFIALGQFKGLHLDVGCGLAYVPQVAGNYGITSVGLDIDRNVLDLAKMRKSAKTSLVRGDGTKLPFRNGKFDCVSAVALLEHVGDKGRTIREMARVLKSDGILFMFVENKLWYVEPHTKLPFASLLPKHLVDFLCRRLRPGFLEWYKSYRYISLPSYQELKNRLIEAKLAFSILPRIGGFIIFPVIHIQAIGECDIQYYLETEDGKCRLNRYLSRSRRGPWKVALMKILKVFLKKRIAKWMSTSWIITARHELNGK